MLIWRYCTNSFLKEWPFDYFNNNSLKYLINLNFTFIMFYKNFLNSFFNQNQVYFAYFYLKLKKIWFLNKKIIKKTDNRVERSVLGLFNFDNLYKFNNNSVISNNKTSVYLKIYKNKKWLSKLEFLLLNFKYKNIWTSFIFFIFNIITNFFFLINLHKIIKINIFTNFNTYIYYNRIYIK